MSLLDQIHAEYEKIVTALREKFGHEVGNDAAHLAEQAREQAGEILKTAESDVKADAAVVATDVEHAASEAVPAQPAPAPES